MLLPTQQAASGALTGFMRSILDDIEQRRAEEEEKTKSKGRKQDEALKVQAEAQSVDAAKVANDKINAHFFGLLKADGDPLANLIARFTDALGLTQGEDESASDFATRLDDALTLTDLVSKTLIDKPMPVSLKTLGVSADEVIAAMDPDSAGDPQISAMARMAGRLAAASGVTADDPNFAVSMQAALTRTRAGLPTSVASLEASTGLTDLGISAAEMIEAIRHPYGETMQKIKSALEEQAVNDKTMTTEVKKALQRMEDVADPKSIEELKYERVNPDPTEVEDSETRQEREQDIRSLEAGEKLEDVQDVQDALEERNDQAADAKGGENAEPGSGAVIAATTDALHLVQALAAGLENARVADKADNDNALDTTATAADDGQPAEPGRMSEEDQTVLLASLDPTDPESGPQAQDNAILTLHVDEIGIYELLKSRNAA